MLFKLGNVTDKSLKGLVRKFAEDTSISFAQESLALCDVDWSGRIHVLVHVEACGLFLRIPTNLQVEYSPKKGWHITSSVFADVALEVSEFLAEKIPTCDGKKVDDNEWIHAVYSVSWMKLRSKIYLPNLFCSDQDVADCCEDLIIGSGDTGYAEVKTGWIGSIPVAARWSYKGKLAEVAVGKNKTAGLVRNWAKDIAKNASDIAR